MSTEARQLHPAEPRWIKSSYSGGDGGECVEIAAEARGVMIRDSKFSDGPCLAVPGATWSRFIRFAAGT